MKREYPKRVKRETVPLTEYMHIFLTEESPKSESAELVS